MNKSMFESIKDALNKKSGTSGFGDMLKTEIGKSYEVKILPNVNAPEKTFFHYYMHGWTSRATGQYVSILSPTTFNERDPISEDRFKTLKLGTEEEQEDIKSVYRSEKWLVNVLVIKDPTNPDNEGQVKILRYGKQLQKIIMEAIEGDDAEEFGEKVFDLNPGNAVLKIKVDSNGDFANYTTSRFTTGTKFTLEGDKVQEVFGQLHDLENIYEPKSYEEVKDFYNLHFKLCEDKPAATEKADQETETKLINELSGAQSDATDSAPPEDQGGESEALTGDDEIDALLGEID